MKSMRTFIFLLALFSISSVAVGQVDDKKLYKAKIGKFKSMKSGGFTLMFLGAALTGIGIANANDKGVDRSPTTFFVPGGLTMFAAGIPLAVVGSVKTKEYRARLSALSVRLDHPRRQAELVFSYRF
jgi:hypothetical protein